MAFGVAHLSELLYGVVVAMVGAHKREHGSRHHAVCHDAAGATALVELPRGVGNGQIGSRQLDEFLFHRNAQAHLHAAVGVLLNVEHIAPEDAFGEVDGVEIFEECGSERQQISFFRHACGVHQVAVEEVVGVEFAAQLHNGIGEEVGGGDERIVHGGVGQHAFVDWGVACPHFGCAVPNLVDIAILVNLTVEIAAKHQRQFVALGLPARRGNHKVAFRHVCQYVDGAFAIELCANHTHGVVAGEGIERTLEPLLD